MNGGINYQLEHFESFSFLNILTPLSYLIVPQKMHLRAHIFQFFPRGVYSDLDSVP